MQITNTALWEKFKHHNQDSYGLGICGYAERWANLMELEIAVGKKLEDIAEHTSKAADTEGATAFMSSAALLVLCSVWEHGESLRRWHNKKVSIGDAGERANESGAVPKTDIISVRVRGIRNRKITKRCK